MRCVDLYNQTQCKWFEEMVTTSMVTPSLKKEQIDPFISCDLLNNPEMSTCWKSLLQQKEAILDEV